MPVQALYGELVIVLNFTITQYFICRSKSKLNRDLNYRNNYVTVEVHVVQYVKFPLQYISKPITYLCFY